MLADHVIARLKAQVPALASRVEGAADLAAVMRTGGMPQVTPAAHVVPAGLTGGKTAPLTGMFRQQVGRLISVVLYFRSRDRRSSRGLDGVGGVIDDIVGAIVGWSPDPTSAGLFELRGCRLVSAAADALVYLIDFVLPDELRITP